jgi:outer membrane protein OmpA-like peptidoglycan-associated protein
MPSARALRLTAILALAAATPLVAQQRRYLLEVNASGGYVGFDDKTNLGGGAGAIGRLGIWLLRNLSVEGEFGYFAPKSDLTKASWSATVFGGAAVGNLPIGSSTSVFLRAGYGSISFDSDNCIGVPPRSIFGACGSSGVILGGAGVRVGLTPTVLLRVEGLLSHSSSGGNTSSGITNLGASAGLSLMLGSKPLVDRDGDGIYDLHDRCPDTPAGALTDSDGCPTDTDRDDVFDGLDRCPTTPVGAKVNEVGCPLDSDGDNVPDGIDACDNTPVGSAVDAKGCPIDSDGDGVADGLDRCPVTPAGASVDQLGCPGDEDGDRVLDGLDRCPRTPPGTVVNAFGCPPGVPPGTEGSGRLRPGSKEVLSGVQFAPRSARLPDAGRAALDSLAAELKARPDVTIEVAAYGDGTAQETQTLTQLRAEAVRRYLITKGVSLRQLVAKGYGNADPISTEGGTAAQNRNRRIELHVLDQR